MQQDYVDWLPTVLSIARSAAIDIMKFYKNNRLKTVETKIKPDLSPVTMADMWAHDFISKSLSAFTPKIPVLSEESDTISFSERSTWSRYWLIDPLDGTKEFLAGTGEFAINIALIEDHNPILGVVMVPVLKEIYWAIKEQGAYRQKANHKPERIYVNTPLQTPIKVAITRRHASHSAQMQALFEQLRQLCGGGTELEWIVCGSALKICLVASGIADIYPRFGVTGEWDTAAGQCILEAAGGKLCDLTGNSLKYNTKSSLCNPGFLAIGSLELNNLFCG